MNKYESEILKKINSYSIKYSEDANTVFLDEDVFYYLRCKNLVTKDNKIMGLNIIKTCQEYDFIHVTRVEY